MDNKVQMLWTSECNYEDWKDDLEELYPDYSDAERQEIMCELNGDYLNDLRDNMDVQLEGPILVIGDLGLWKGDLRATFYHHDGTNYYLYRAIMKTATEEEIDELEDKIYYQTVTRADICRTTRRLGDMIARVYGWPVEYPAEQR